MWTRRSDDASLKGRPGVAVRLVPADDIKISERQGRAPRTAASTSTRRRRCPGVWSTNLICRWSTASHAPLPGALRRDGRPAGAQSLGGFSITYRVDGASFLPAVRRTRIDGVEAALHRADGPCGVCFAPRHVAPASGGSA